VTIAATTIILRDSHSSWAALVVPALAGIGGALVGGLVTGVLTLRGEDRRQAFARELEESRLQREDAERAASVRGSIRLLRITLREAAGSIKNALETGAWWPAALDLSPSIRPEDLSELAASMSGSEWTEIELALSQAGRIQITRSVHPRLTPEGFLPPVDEGGRGALRVAAKNINAAVEVLRRVDSTN
jgi:hypothetical protein